MTCIHYNITSTFGEKSMNLDLRPSRNYRWLFLIAGIPIPILGADFNGTFRSQS